MLQPRRFAKGFYQVGNGSLATPDAFLVIEVGEKTQDQVATRGAVGTGIEVYAITARTNRELCTATSSHPIYCWIMTECCW